MVQKAVMFSLSWLLFAIVRACMKSESKNEQRANFMAKNNLNDHIDHDGTNRKMGH